MEVWIDCISYIDGLGSAMSDVVVKEGETLRVEILNSLKFKQRCLGVYKNLMECTAIVNVRMKKRATQIKLNFM